MVKTAKICPIDAPTIKASTNRDAIRQNSLSQGLFKRQPWGENR